MVKQQTETDKATVLVELQLTVCGIAPQDMAGEMSQYDLETLIEKLVLDGLTVEGYEVTVLANQDGGWREGVGL